MESALELIASGLDGGYKKLCDFGDYVLAGKERQKGQGYEFVTWQYSYNKTDVSIGHYFEDDFAAAKQGFALRCGLVNPHQFFAEEQLADIYRNNNEALENGTFLTPEEYERTAAIQRQIECVLPDITNQIIETEQPSEQHSWEQTM